MLLIGYIVWYIYYLQYHYLIVSFRYYSWTAEVISRVEASAEECLSPSEMLTLNAQRSA